MGDIWQELNATKTQGSYSVRLNQRCSLTGEREKIKTSLGSHSMNICFCFLDASFFSLWNVFFMFLNDKDVMPRFEIGSWGSINIIDSLSTVTSTESRCTQCTRSCLSAVCQLFEYRRRKDLQVLVLSAMPSRASLAVEIGSIYCGKINNFLLGRPSPRHGMDRRSMSQGRRETNVNK